MKTLFLALALVSFLPACAEAQYYNRHYAPPPQYHNHHHHHSPGIGPFVGGLALGGILGGMMVAPPPPVYHYVPQCYTQHTGYYDNWGRPVMERICR